MRVVARVGKVSVETNKLPLAVKRQANGSCVLSEGTWPNENGAGSIGSKFVD